ncbi:MAG: hypothetical protein JW809_03350 [Pirellulales bacterium]|nr:hypothetical protein [Pirellulales bacterium]
MSENPFQSPPEFARAMGVRSGRREDVRSVAIYQKGIIVCILFQLLAYAALVFNAASLGSPLLEFLAGMGFLMVSLAGFIFIVLLSMKVYNVVVGVVLGLLVLVPLLGLLVLLGINGKATKILQTNGHRVGLLGADLSRF